MQTSIATVSHSGRLSEKLEAISAAKLDGVATMAARQDQVTKVFVEHGPVRLHQRREPKFELKA